MKFSPLVKSTESDTEDTALPMATMPTNTTSQQASAQDSVNLDYAYRWTPVDESESKGRVAFEQLYPEESLIHPHLLQARELLAEGVERISSAHESAISGDQLEAEDMVSRFSALLPELFCVRQIGDGFAYTVVALHHSIRNRSAEPFTPGQLYCLKKVTQSIKDMPYLEFDQSRELVKLLKEEGFDPTIRHLSELTPFD